MKNRGPLKGIMKTFIQPACYFLIAVMSFVWTNATEAAVGDGKLLRRETDQICYGCHKIETDSTKVNAGALRIHNSANTASEKWAKTVKDENNNDILVDYGWGIAGGKYGEFKCTTCHTTHNTQNIFMIKETITAPSAPTDSFSGSAADFRTRVGTPGVTPGTMADDTAHDRTSTNICRVCHSKNKVHNYDWALNTEEHHNADNCSNCHTHEKGFSVQCGECHGDKNAQPVTGLPISLETLVSKFGGTGSVTPGKHEKHYTVQKYSCTTCHGVTAHDTRIAIGFTFKDKNGGTYSGRALSNGFAYNAGAGTTIPGAGGTGGMKCSNIYCHSNAAPLGKANAYREVTWDGAATTCASCHDQKGSSTTPTELSAAHSRHVDDGWYRFTCNKCHNDTVSDNSTIKDRTKHVNATKDIALTGGGSYNGTAHSCSSVYCHSNAKLGTDVGAYTTPAWDAGAMTCSSCHGNSPSYASGAAGSATANSHVRHTSKNIGCQKCHALTTTTGTTITGYSTHVNNQIDVWFNPLSTASDSVGTYTPATKTCSVSRCHGSGTPQWGGVVVCGTCHVIDNTLAGRHASHFGLALNHGIALSNPDGNIATGNASTATQYAFKCGDCHKNTVHGGGSVNDNRAAEVLFDTDTAGGGTYTEGSSQGQDPNTSYNWTAGTCASTYCHSQGTTTTAPYLAPQNNAFNWASAANIDADFNIKCKGCHKYTTASGAPMITGKHSKHVDTYGLNCSKCHNATTTTGTTITDKSKHINRAREIAWDSTNTGGSDYSSPNCDNIYCHSQGRKGSAPYATVSVANDNAPKTRADWTVALDCTGCHGGDSTTAANAMSTYSHSKHINSTVSDKFKCETCHSATASQNTTIISTTKHVSKTVDISFSSPNSNATYNGTPNLPNGISKTPGTVPTAANATCSGLYCHSQGTSLTAPSAPNKAAVWGGSLNDSCSGCHSGASDAAYIMTNGSHSRHLNNTAKGIDFTCGACHNATVQADTSRTIVDTTKHLNKKINIQFANALNPTGSYSKSGEFDPGSAGGTCSSLYCHSNGKGTYVAPPAWGSNTWVNVCNGCHGAAPKDDTTNPNGAPDYATGVGAENSHAKHAINAATSQNYNCSKCHNQTTTTGTTITGTTHIDKTIQVAFDSTNSGANAYGTPDAKQCSNLYCHSNAQATAYSTVTWGGAAMTCTSCHNNSRANDAANSTPTGLSDRHSMHVDTGAQADSGMGTVRYGLTCNRCHNATASSNTAISDRTKHVDKTKDVVFSQTGGTYNTDNQKSCSNIYCHSQARLKDEANPALGWQDPYKPVKWGDTNLAMQCYSCHKGRTDDDTSDNCTLIGGVWDSEKLYCKSHYNTQADCTSAGGSWNSDRRACETTAAHADETECRAAGLTWHQSCKAPGALYDTEAKCTTVGGVWMLNAGHYACYFYSYSNSNAASGSGVTQGNASYNSSTACANANGGWEAICSSPHNIKTSCDAIGGVWDEQEQLCRGSYLTMNSNGHGRLTNKNWIRKYPCYYCHDETMNADGTIKDISKHVNGEKNVAVNAFWKLQGSNPPDATYDSGSKVCSNVYCHTDGTKDRVIDGTTVSPVIKNYPWTGGHKECDGCHGHPEGDPPGSCNTTTVNGVTKNNGCHTDGRTDFSLTQKFYKAMPIYTSAGTGVEGANSHPRHVFSNFSCEACHNLTVAAACKNCHVSNPTGAMAESGHVDPDYHLNKQKNINFAITGSYDLNPNKPKSCQSTACHGGEEPQWGGSVTAGVTCFSCHGSSTVESDDYTFSADMDPANKAKIKTTEWDVSGHGRASGNYSVSNNPAANFAANSNPCAYCHDNSVMHNDSANPFRLRKHAQFEVHFEKECVYCHMQGTDSECLACHNTGESIAPQLSKLGSSSGHTRPRPDHKNYVVGGVLPPANSCTQADCHPKDRDDYIHNTSAGLWTEAEKADLKSQYMFIGVCLKCHDDDSSGQCAVCHKGTYNVGACADPNDSSKKYALGFNPTTDSTLCRKPSKAKASSFHFGYKHSKFFEATGGWGCSGMDSGTCAAAGGTWTASDSTCAKTSKFDTESMCKTANGTMTARGRWKGGKFCWDCHDPHGDSNIYMIQGKVSTETDGKYGIPKSRSDVVFTAKNLGTDYVKSSGTINGICNVCHETLTDPTKTSQGTCEAAGYTWNATNSTCVIVEGKHWYNTGGDGHNSGLTGFVCTSCHEHRFGSSHASGQTCNACHAAKPIPRQEAFGLPRDCNKCHAATINNRMNIMSQMKGNSHHAQFSDQNKITNRLCYACHWEATEFGLIDLERHTGYNYKTKTSVKDAQVDLVIWQSGGPGSPTVGTRPTTYNLGVTATTFLATQVSTETTDAGSARTNIANVTTHCLSCHSDQNNDAIPFSYCSDPLSMDKTTCESTDPTCSKTGYTEEATCLAAGGTWSSPTWESDCKTPRQYAWDRNSIAARYSQAGTTTWGKYTGTTNAATKNMTKAFSAHGNATANKQGGWSTSTGVDGDLSAANTTGTKNVQCFDCHSSHGSKLSGVTSSYTTFNGSNTGGNLKEAQAGKGGYPNKYTATANTTGINPYSTGAAQCFDCHETANSGTTISGSNKTPWGYTTFGATAPVKGYMDSARFGSGTAGFMTRSSYKSKAMAGGHLRTSYGGQASSATTNNILTDANQTKWTVDSVKDSYVIMNTGTAAGQYRLITANTTTQLTLLSAFSGQVSVNDFYSIIKRLPQKEFASGSATGGTTTTLTGSFPSSIANSFVLMTSGPNAGQSAQIASNTSTEITLASAFTEAVANGNTYSLTTPSLINGLCTPCHDPHGVSPSLGSNMQYAVPLLKGTWMTSPYKEDIAPTTAAKVRGTGSGSGSGSGNDWKTGSGGGSGHGTGGTSAGVTTPGYNIDQNTFASWNWSSASRISETSDQFAGLCLNCHPRAVLNSNGTDVAKAPWKGLDRVHNTVKDWGGQGTNAGNAIHSYSCSKCHVPHVADNPRLLATNCIDYKHRGKVASGGNPIQGGGTGSGSGSGSGGSGPGMQAGSGSGNGSGGSVADTGSSYPFGGGGSGSGSGGMKTKANSSRGPLNVLHNGSGSGAAVGFGKRAAGTRCHDTAPGNTDPATTRPVNQLWNSKSPW